MLKIGLITQDIFTTLCLTFSIFISVTLFHFIHALSRAVREGKFHFIYIYLFFLQIEYITQLQVCRKESGKWKKTPQPFC